MTQPIRSCAQCDGTGIDYSRATEAVPDPKTGEPTQRGPEPCDICRGTGEIEVELTRRELVQPFVDGKSFRCQCGANVFKRLEEPSYRSVHVFACNACGRMYKGTAMDKGKSTQ